MSRRSFAWLLAAVAVCLLCYFRSEHDPYARYVLEGYEKIDHQAYEDVPDDELYQGAMRGMVGVLNAHGDQHSAFISGRDAKLFREEMNQEIGGIGVRLQFDGDPPVLQVAGPPVPDKPAEEAGVRAGDIILAIDDFSTVGLTPADLSEAVRRMRGNPGESLELTVMHAGDTTPVTIQLTRAKLTLDSVRGDRLLPDQSWQYQLEEDPRIALVRITSFGTKSVSELIELLPQLKGEGAKALILDLRNNPGGPLEAAIETCELFLPAGQTIVETRDRLGRQQSADRSRGDGPYRDMPLVVLVNRESASASEIVAACLQDHDRAVVIGERSFGKGTVQELIPLSADGGMLKLTRATYWRPSGENIHRHGEDRQAALSDPDWGVSPTPGFEVEQTEEELVELAKARAERDTTAYDPDADPDFDEPLFIDPAVDVAVAYLEVKLATKRSTE